MGISTRSWIASARTRGVGPSSTRLDTASSARKRWSGRLSWVLHLRSTSMPACSFSSLTLSRTIISWTPSNSPLLLLLPSRLLLFLFIYLLILLFTTAFFINLNLPNSNIYIYCTVFL